MSDNVTLIRHIKKVCIPIFLVGVIIFLYWPTADYGLVDYDDVEYVLKNSNVIKGITVEGLKWALSSFYQANWHPITWFSHMLDIQLFGFNTGMYHVTNIFFHSLNAILVYVFLARLTGKLWPAALAALLFAIHPVHVESVAWVAERKDLLSMFFMMLSLISYLKYGDTGKKKFYYMSLALFLLGLMAKPMVVTLPCILLLIDYWPLGRIPVNKNSIPVPHTDYAQKVHPIVEKIPFFLLSIFDCFMTVMAQSSGGTVASIEAVPLGIRMSNALISYSDYLCKIIYPSNLSVLYPYPESISIIKLSLAIIILLFCLSAAVYSYRSKPYIAFGLLWFLGTLVPVIGIIQVGSQAMADRYLYIPSIGIYLILVLVFYDTSKKYQFLKKALYVILPFIFSVFFIKSSTQITYWKDGGTLFKHAISVTERNHIAYANLGVFTSNAGNSDDAIKYYLKAIEISPSNSSYHRNLGAEYKKKKDYKNAIKHLEISLRIDPKMVDSLSYLASISYTMGDYNKMKEYIDNALTLDPNEFTIYNLMGLMMMDQGDLESSMSFFSKALSLSPENPFIFNNIGLLLKRQGKNKEASEFFLKALMIDPNNKLFKNNFAEMQGVQ